MADVSFTFMHTTAHHPSPLRIASLITTLIIAPSLLSYIWIVHFSALFTNASYQMVSIFIYLILLSNIVVKILLKLIEGYDSDKKNHSL